MSNSPLDTVVRHIRRMALGKNCRECSDAQLLRQFVNQRDEAAFTALVRRHERLVWRVCWNALGHVQDAEDTFQATFVVLAQSAAKIAKQEMVGSWLHGVALRIALRVRRDAARRRKHEREAANMPRRSQSSELSWREVCQVLDEEVQRLPQKYRAPFVFCVLEEKSVAEAARLLGWKEGTVSGRLTRARKLLKERLGRREIRLAAALAGLTLVQSTVSGSVPSGLSAVTIQTALSCFARPEAAADILPAQVTTLVQGAMKPMLSSKIKFASLMFLAVNCGLVGVGLCAREPADARLADPPPAAKAADAKAGIHGKTAQDAEAATVALSGRVLDPGGKPVEGAKLYLFDRTAGQALVKIRAATGADGRFRFPIASSELARVRGRYDHLVLLAAAPRYGPAFHQFGASSALSDFTLRLLADDLPIKGRILTLEGKPVAGAEVRIVGFKDPKRGDLAAFLDALRANKEEGYPAENEFLNYFVHPGLSSLFPKVRTDADGRFQIKGIGRERMAIVNLSGPTIEASEVRVMTRAEKGLESGIGRPAWRGVIGGTRLTYYGATFEHAANPTTPVSGIVRDKDTGRPLQGAAVMSTDLTDGQPLIQAVTDKDGRYLLTGLPRKAGNHVRIRGPEGESYLEVVQGVPAARGSETVTVDAELKHGVRIKGRVTDKVTGKPVSALVEYFVFRDNPNRSDAPGLWPRLSTKDDGVFEFIGLPGRGLIGVRAIPDKYLVCVGIENFKTEGDELRTIVGTSPGCFAVNYHTLVGVEPAKDAASLTCNITVDPGRTLTGVVVGPDGKPLPGARLAAAMGLIAPFWTDETQPTAEFTVYAVKEGQKRNVLVLHEEKHLAGCLMLRGEEKGPLTIKLKPWGVITGRLVTSDGQPRSGIELTLRRLGRRLFDPTCGYHPIRAFHTDKDGKFRIDALVPGLKYTMHVVNKRGVIGGAVFEDLTLESGETKDLGDVQVKQ